MATGTDGSLKIGAGEEGQLTFGFEDSPISLLTLVETSIPAPAPVPAPAPTLAPAPTEEPAAIPRDSGIPKGWTPWKIGDPKPRGARVEWMNEKGNKGRTLTEHLCWGDEPDKVPVAPIKAYKVVE